ncbi:MAG: AraC family transcriptional regulator [Bacteroidaceae bacterium]|nr:AraC family transcriptional regulator [Bacteroidaceae bacterium]
MNKKSSLNSVACLIFSNYDAMLITILVIVIGFEVWIIYLLLKVNNQRKNLQSIDIEEQQEDKNEEVEIPENLQTLPKLYDFESYTSEFLYDTPETPYMYNKKRRKNFFDLCIETIHENIKEVDYNAKILADDLNVERTNLYKKLKPYTDISPLKLIKQLRIEKAISLLENSEMPVDIIVKECGFKNYKSMKSLFMEHISKTPEEFRVKEDNESDLQDESQSQQLL